MGLDAGKASPHEEGGVIRLAARRDGVGIDLRPQHRPAVMRFHWVRTVEQSHIGGQIFAKIRHPA